MNSEEIVGLTALVGVVLSILSSFITTYVTCKNQTKINADTIKAQNVNLQNEMNVNSHNLEKNLKSELKINNKRLAVEHITDKRVDWMYEVRNELSVFIAKAFYIVDKYKSTVNKVPASLDYMDLNKSLAKLKLLFNIDDGRDIVIIKLLESIKDNLSISNNDFNFDTFIDDCNKLTRESQIYLKLEWERVKIETSEDISKEELDKRLLILEDRLNIKYNL